MLLLSPVLLVVSPSLPLPSFLSCEKHIFVSSKNADTCLPFALFSFSLPVSTPASSLCTNIAQDREESKTKIDSVCVRLVGSSSLPTVMWLATVDSLAKRREVTEA